jgi:NitT/TauT family transport system substrate-binding protein
MNKTLYSFISLFAIAVIVIFGIFFFNRNSQKSSSSTEKLTIAMVTFPGYAPLYLAQEKGFFGNLQVELKRIENPSDLRSAMDSKSINGYIATHDMFMSTQGTKPMGTAVMIIDTSKGADGIIVDNSIEKISDLRGKTIAIEPGFPAYLVLQYLLDKNNMKLSDVIVKDMTTTDAASAFVSKSVLSAGLYEPSLNASLKARKDTHLLASTNDVNILFPNLASDLLFVNPTLITEKPENLKQFMLGYFKALDYIKTNPNESNEIMGKAFGMSATEMKEFQTGIVWIPQEEQIALFDTKAKGNIFETFSLVNSLLLKNNNTNLTFDAHETISNSIINSL